jgi:hypothetical protein
LAFSVVSYRARGGNELANWLDTVWMRVAFVAFLAMGMAMLMIVI